jgi:hypothetical protein
MKVIRDCYYLNVGIVAYDGGLQGPLRYTSYSGQWLAIMRSAMHCEI